MFAGEVRIYPLTDVGISGLSHAEQVTLLSEGGATLIQLREKHLPPRDFYKQAEEALRVARKRSVRIIINDRADIALALKADGIHLGQADLPPSAARRLLGDQAIIGLSTHNMEEIRKAKGLPIDYLAIGPIFATSSKGNADPVIGLEGLRQARKTVGRLPLVAIGGISREHVAQVLDAGADAVAVIGAVLANPEEIASRMKGLLDASSHK